MPVHDASEEQPEVQTPENVEGQQEKPKMKALVRESGVTVYEAQTKQGGATGSFEVYPIKNGEGPDAVWYDAPTAVAKTRLTGDQVLDLFLERHVIVPMPLREPPAPGKKTPMLVAFGVTKKTEGKEGRVFHSLRVVTAPAIYRAASTDADITSGKEMPIGYRIDTIPHDKVQPGKKSPSVAVFNLPKCFECDSQGDPVFEPDGKTLLAPINLAEAIALVQDGTPVVRQTSNGKITFTATVREDLKDSSKLFLNTQWYSGDKPEASQDQSKGYTRKS